MSEFIPAEIRWFFTSNDNNKTIALNDSVVIRQCGYSRQYFASICRQGLHLDSVERQDAGRYDCAVFAHGGPSRSINLYNVTYALRVYGQTDYSILDAVVVLG